MPATQRRPRRGLPASLLVAVVGLGLLIGTTAAPVRAAAFDRFYANFAGEELMRAMNADRVALGLPRLASDVALERIARDRALTCPSNSSLVIRGRARDMADRSYLSHNIKGCYKSNGSAFTTFDLLHAFGYTYTAAAENIADNNYPASATTYATGCSLYGTSCHGAITLPWTVAVAERGFMGSSLHRANILSTSYGRFGCAAWASSTGYHYFACYFTRWGNGQVDSTPPAIGSLSGVGATFRVGATPTFTATVSDNLSVLSDGDAYLDGARIKGWAWAHAGLSASISATVPALKAGPHTLKWVVRDASTYARSASFQFTVTG